MPEDPATASPVKAGTIYVVATPIGNLGDFSPRARDVLAGVALIAAEDTRHTRQLLQAFGIATASTSLHEHNESQKSIALLQRVRSGESLAIVSDAGTPLISDPGYGLIAAAREQGIEVIAVPGPCAAIAALSVAGLPTDRFVFAGFLPAKSAARRAELETVAADPRTLVFYEAPHRLHETLRDMAAVFGAERRATVSRELTKRFETTYSDSLARLADAAGADENMSRGEIVIVVAGAPAQKGEAVALDVQRVLRALLDELSPAQAAKVAARITGAKRGDLYDLAVRMGRDPAP